MCAVIVAFTINHPIGVGWLIVIATNATRKTVEIDEYMHIVFISLIDRKGTIFFRVIASLC